MRGQLKMEFVISKLGIFAFVAILTASTPVVSENNENAETYDFIVVGAGIGGCVVASRLSENGKYTVLLLESGGYPHSNLNIPALSPHYLTPEFVKTYLTVPQRNIAGQQGGIIPYFAGRVLGGGSSINGMHYNRGHSKTYDHWANITGDPSWSYANMLPYFKKVEDYKGKFPLTDQHGTGGPVTVSRTNYVPGLEEWLSAGRSLGYPVVDPNGPQQESFTAIEFTKRFGRRDSAYLGYIAPVITTRPNLKVVSHVEVGKILFENIGENIRATGVIYTKTSEQNTTSTVTVQARKEVIISAGALGSPTLLLRSGVGPLSHLQECGVPVVKALPVGENLQDHSFVRMNFLVNTTDVFVAERDLNENTLKVFNETGDGPYTTYWGDTAQAFLTSSPTSSTLWPDLHFVLGWSGGNGGIINKTDVDDTQSVGVTCLNILTNPKSRGILTLNRTHVEEDPVIDFRYLEDPDDMRAMIDGIKRILTIFEETATFQKLGAKYNPPPLPACGDLPFRSDEYWTCVIRQTGTIGYHAGGSCTMGIDGSPDAVVNTQLQVIGISGLRVVDASVMPVLTNANTQAPVYGIAEKASDMILQKWNAFKREEM